MSIELLNKYGVNTPKGGVAKTPQEAHDVFVKLGIFLLTHANR